MNFTMDKNQILKKLNDNLQELSNVENKIAMIQLALYQKSLEELRENKLNELNTYLEQQAKFYNQDVKNYRNKIDEIIENYNKQIKELISSYDYLYVNFFKMMEDAINNQKIAIANIITLVEKLNNDNVEKEESKLNNTIIACAQKKLNYAVIIEECKARINWCIENAQNDINEIFDSNMEQLQEYKNDAINKFFRKIFNFLSGKNKYEKILNTYKIDTLKCIEKKSKSKILDCATILSGVMKQIDMVKKQILAQYNAMLLN